MAVDTRDKRYSAMSIGLPWRGAYPIPDGDISATDRRFLSRHYSGIAAPPPPSPPVYTMSWLELSGTTLTWGTLTGTTLTWSTLSGTNLTWVVLEGS